MTLKEETKVCGKSDMNPTVSLAKACCPEGR